MNLGVIGEPCIDFVYKPGRETKKSLGGILYSLISLAVLCGNEHKVFPVMYIGADEFENITSFIAAFKNIRSDFIIKSEHKTRVVDLFYKDEAEGFYDREESSTYPVPPVGIDHLEKALPLLDALLINMVSGIDISLDTLKKIRVNFTGYIHVDLHNMTMQTEPDGTRVRRAAANWEEWCTNCNTVQMNESELSVMTENKLKEAEVAEKILGRTKALIVTRGKEGVTMYAKKNKQICRTDIPAAESSDFSDSTGCGDVFASAFFFKNVIDNQNDYLSALRFANSIAAGKTQFTGVEELTMLFDLRGAE